MKCKFLLSGIAVAAALGIGVAVAQISPPVNMVQALGQADLVKVVPNGTPTPTTYWANPGAIAGVEQYSYQVPLTAFTITVPNTVSLMVLNPAGTLATGTLTMAANPADGQRFCLYDSQTQTAITVDANTNQTLNTTIGIATPTALTAKTKYCWVFMGNVSGLAAWVRTS